MKKLLIGSIVAATFCMGTAMATNCYQEGGSIPHCAVQQCDLNNKATFCTMMTKNVVNGYYDIRKIAPPISTIIAQTKRVNPVTACNEQSKISGAPKPPAGQTCVQQMTYFDHSC